MRSSSPARGSTGRRLHPAAAIVLVLYTIGVIVAAVVAFRFLSRVDRRRRGVLPMLGAIAVVAVVYIGLCGLCFGGLSLVGLRDVTLALRPYTPLRMVLTVCGRCFSDDPDREIDYETDILQGNLVAMDGVGLPPPALPARPWRGHVSLYEEDVTVWEDLQQWRIPTREIVPDRAGNTRPIPMGYLDGLGDLQTQHSCVLLVDVTETCNLECPTCFAISGPGRRAACAAERGAADARCRDRARGRPDRRADAVGRRADGPPRRSSTSSAPPSSAT